MLEREVARDRAALEQLEAVVVEVGHLPERLHGDELGRLVLALGEVDRDELERHAELLRDGAHAVRARRVRVAVELKDHDGAVG